MPAQAIPTATDILVIGGGPAGAYAASVPGREGFAVAVLKKEHFPRYHIGESMLPSCRTFMRFIGAEEKAPSHGFTVKVGAAVKLNQYKREGYTEFILPDPNKAAWNVVRSEFDEILLRHAAESGACVCEGIQVTDITFSSDDDKRPVSAQWKFNSGGKGEVRFKWLVDASGRNGVLSTEYLKNRKFNQALKNIAYWGYFTGAVTYALGTRRENAPWVEALTNETGWAWFIPLHNGTVSVGVVLNEQASRGKKSTLVRPDITQTHYLAQLDLAPGVICLLGTAKLTGKVKSAEDYSYSASHPYLSTAFIDPFFSSGVHLAFTNGLSAASTIAASIRKHCTEAEAIRFHNLKTGTSYTRFPLVLLSVYRQMIAQAVPVLSDIDEDNFDRAFDLLRPIIQGTADADQAVTEQTLQRTMDSREHTLGPATPEMQAEVAKRVDPSLLAHHGPIMDTETVSALSGKDDEFKHVLLQINARKTVWGIYDWQQNFRAENLGGFSVVLGARAIGVAALGRIRSLVDYMYSLFMMNCRCTSCRWLAATSCA
ncbi:putative halogenase [Mycena leptocephala]|nr:putative halogenase [Mycena leptocephala]